MKKYNIRTLLKRGADHHVNCEDSSCFIENEYHIFAAVFDGCSDGTKSHFASELMAKFFRSAVNEIPVGMETNLSSIANYIFSDMMLNLCQFSRRCYTPMRELLSTVVYTIINKENGKSITVFCGDGVFFVNGKSYVIDQNNTPDYMAHYINTLNNMEPYLRAGYCIDLFENNRNVFFFNNISDISISTDGLLSYQKVIKNEDIVSLQRDDEVTKYVSNFICVDDGFYKTNIMLSRKHVILEKQGYSHYDDIAVIRIFEKEE